MILHVEQIILFLDIRHTAIFFVDVAVADYSLLFHVFTALQWKEKIMCSSRPCKLYEEVRQPFKLNKSIFFGRHYVYANRNRWSARQRVNSLFSIPQTAYSISISCQRLIRIARNECRLPCSSDNNNNNNMIRFADIFSFLRTIELNTNADSANCDDKFDFRFKESSVLCQRYCELSCKLMSIHRCVRQLPST